MSGRTVVVGPDVTHQPGDARDWRLVLPPCDRLVAPGGVRSLTASVLWAAWRQRVPVVAVRDAGGVWRETTPAALLAGRAGRRLRAMGPGAAALAWARVLACDRPVCGRAEGPVVMVVPSLAGDGAQRQMAMLAGGLAARGWPVRVLVRHLRDRPGAAALAPGLAAAGIPVAVWTDPPPHDTPGLARLERAAAGLPDALAGDLLAVAGWLAAWRPRAVHGWLDGTAVVAGVAAALGVPAVVVGLRNRAPDRHGHPLAGALRPGLAALARHPAVTVTGNAAAVAADHARWAGIAAPLVIPNGVAVPASGPPPAGLAPLVLGVFRLVAHKRPLLWLDVAARVAAARPDVRFRLLGDGPLRGAVAARAAALGVAVEAPGWVPEVGPHLAEAAVLLHVSAAEGLPNAILEAQAAGVPVVAAPAGGVAEALAGLPVAPPTPAAVAARVVDLLNDTGACARLAAAGRAHMARLTPAALVARHERLYDTPPCPGDETRRHARAVRLRPAGLARSLGTLARLGLRGEGREIARRVAGLRGRPAPMPAMPPPRPAQPPRLSPSLEGHRPLPVAPAGEGPLRLACVGETWRRDGAPLSLWELASGLVGRGAVTPALSLVLHDGPLGALWAAAGWPVTRIAPGRLLGVRDLDRLAARVAQALADSGAGVVLVNGLRAFAGAIAARTLGRPALWVIREPGPEALADLSVSVQARALAALAEADRVVFVSHTTARAWAAWVAPDRATVIPNALPPRAEGAPSRMSSGAGGDREDRVLLAAGALDPRKGPLDLIAALPLLPDALHGRVRLLWAGRDAEGYGRRVRAAVARLPDPWPRRVVLLGERADMAALWAAADVAVCPSRAEAAPRVVLEAARAGLPVVATAVGGIPEQAARWPATWLVPPADPPALARGLAAALRAPRPAAPAGDDGARYGALLDSYTAVLRVLAGQA
ncbi:glycosyltransferase [Roseospira goensis]|uniref:Glycosyltransferase involved in cell wall biosynthesis n=1 Tax=Roseospira goensis TaxID=391922 RepID=A0A7W6RYZ1_9PROT|nr:glycosyltransferase [Roseospira goensis]MBB4285831.1 glycosyltransferase involved in cell wall biosynthesis [Roseospira goensis]